MLRPEAMSGPMEAAMLAWVIGRAVLSVLLLSALLYYALLLVLAALVSSLVLSVVRLLRVTLEAVRSILS
jgi:hypothetical protein